MLLLVAMFSLIPVALTVEASSAVPETNLALILTAAVLLSIYVVLALEKLHRTTIGSFGAIVTVVIGIATGLFTAEGSLDFILEAVDFNTIGLLLGMMIIVGILGETGVFQYVGIRAVKMSKGDLWKIMLILCTFTAIVSALIDNVTMVLLMVPVTVSIAKILKINPIPVILAQVFASNVGGTATLIGDPPNIMIASATGLTFNDFLVGLAPSVMITFVASLFLLKFSFRNALKNKPENTAALMELNEREHLKDMGTLKKTLGTLFGVIALFVLHGSIGIEPSVIALAGAAFALLITRAKPERIVHHVDWTTLIFFAGLFVVVAGAEKAGLIGFLADRTVDATGGNLNVLFFVVIWLSAVASAFVDNIPFAATMIPLIETVSVDPSFAGPLAAHDINPLWWALALGVGLGGNGTLVGSSAGVVAIGLAEKHGHHISFNSFLRVGFPYMIVTTLIGSLILFAMTML